MVISDGKLGNCHARSNPSNSFSLANAKAELMNDARRSGSAAMAEKAAFEALFLRSSVAMDRRVLRDGLLTLMVLEKVLRIGSWSGRGTATAEASSRERE